MVDCISRLIWGSVCRKSDFLKVLEWGLDDFSVSPVFELFGPCWKSKIGLLFPFHSRDGWSGFFSRLAPTASMRLLEKSTHGLYSAEGGWDTGTFFSR